MGILKQVKNYFSPKVTPKEKKTNPTNLKVGIHTIKSVRSQKKKQMEAFNMEMYGNKTGPKP